MFAITNTAKRIRLGAKVLRKAAKQRARASAQSAPSPTPRTVRFDDTAESESVASLSDALAVATLTNDAVKEMKENGRLFSKIANRFAFANDVASYNNWVIQFEAELDHYGLVHTVKAPRQADSPHSVLEHKIVYNMILQCVPKVVMPSITVTLSERSAYEAWRVLRRLFIGDEATYLQGLENRFQRVVWADGEEFNAFEVRFEQIVSELESAGQIKPDHVKKAVFMHAIEVSSKKDVRGVHVFDRLNTTSKIHHAQPFKDWMVHLRVEAQQICNRRYDAIRLYRNSKDK
jgi:hypothetical protein